MVLYSEIWILLNKELNKQRAMNLLCILFLYLHDNKITTLILCLEMTFQVVDSDFIVVFWLIWIQNNLHISIFLPVHSNYIVPPIDRWDPWLYQTPVPICCPLQTPVPMFPARPRPRPYLCPCPPYVARPPRAIFSKPRATMDTLHLTSRHWRGGSLCTPHV